MPSIPDFTAVGTSVPTPAYRRPFVDTSGETLGRSIEGLGQAGEMVGQEDYARGVNLARAQASNSLLDHEVQVRGAAENIRQQVAGGQLPWDQASGAFQDAVKQIPTPNVPNLDEIGQQTLTRGMQRNVMGGAQVVQGIARAGQKQAFVDQFQGALDNVGKLAGMPDADIETLNGQLDQYRPMALAAGVPAPEVDKAIQARKDSNWLNQATQRAMEAKDDPQGLQTLQHDLVDSDGYYAGRLDTEKRNTVLRSVINDQMILQNRAEHEQDKREARATATMGRIDEQVASGVPASPDMWEQWGALTKGTSMEQPFQQAQQDENTVQDVLRKPIAEQFNYVQDREQQLDTEGGSLRDRANLMRLKTAITQNANLMQSNPLIFAANRTGTEVQPIDFSAAGTSDGNGQIADAIADRMSTLGALKKQYGPQIGTQPLLPQEVSQLHSQLDAATPLDRAKMLTSLRDSFNNDDAYQAVMRRIAPGSPVTAIAGQMIGEQAPASTPAWYDRNFAPHLSDVTRVLQGEALLNPTSGGKEAASEAEKGAGAVKGGMVMPPEASLRLKFGEQAQDLFGGRPQLAEAHYAVFKDAYAALLAENGDYRGVGDSGAERQALNIALGGKPVDFNGSSLVAPAGMDPTRLPGIIRGAVADAARSMKAPADWADRLQGYQVQELGGLGSGVYKLTQGGHDIASPDGRGPFVIDLHRQFLPGTAGAALAAQAPSGPQPGSVEARAMAGEIGR